MRSKTKSEFIKSKIFPVIYAEAEEIKKFLEKYPGGLKDALKDEEQGMDVVEEFLKREYIIGSLMLGLKLIKDDMDTATTVFAKTGYEIVDCILDDGTYDPTVIYDVLDHFKIFTGSKQMADTLEQVQELDKIVLKEIDGLNEMDVQILEKLGKFINDKVAEKKSGMNKNVSGQKVN